MGKTTSGVLRAGVLLNDRRGLLLVALLLLSVLALSCTSEDRTLEERAQSLDKQVMCPVCPAETIDQSQAEIAVQMRQLVRQKLEAGEDEQQILEFFVDRYGQGVLAKPPQGGFNLLAWLVPPIAVIGGLALLWAAIRQLGRQETPARGAIRGSGAKASSSEGRLEALLQRVDKEFLAFEQAQSAVSSPKNQPGREGR